MATIDKEKVLSVAPTRLASIAYHVVGVHTEAGSTPYTGAANAGGASGLSIGTMQHDFGQRPNTASGYANAVVDWYATNGNSVSFTATQLTTGILSKSLTTEQRSATAEFGSSRVGASWIYDNLEKAHVDSAVNAAAQAFATPYGQEVLKQGTHIEEFAAFSMKVFNQYGGGPSKIDGDVSNYKMPGFQGLLAYLQDGKVELRDNRTGHSGETITVTAKSPEQFDSGDLLAYARGYADTRSNQSETNSTSLGDKRAIVSGPQSALNSGGLYKAILDSDSPLSDVLQRVELKGNFSPTLVGSDPDVAVTRAMFGADTIRMKSAVVAINDETTINPVSVSVTLGQYPGTLWIDPMTERIAISYKGTGGGFVVGSEGYAKFENSAVAKEDGVLKLQIGDGNTKVSFDQAATPLANAALPTAAVSVPGGHWEDRTYYNPETGIAVGGENKVWVPDAKPTTDAPTTTKSPQPDAAHAPDIRQPYIAQSTPVKNPDGTTTTSGIAKGDSGDGFIAKGDQVAAVSDKDGKTLSEVVVHKTANGTEVTERVFGSDDQPTTETYTQTDKDGGVITQITTRGGEVVGDSYTDKGITYTRTPDAQGDVQWLDLSGKSLSEQPAPIDPYDYHFTGHPLKTGSGFTQVGYSRIVLDGKIYGVNTDGTLERRIPGTGLLEVRDSSGGGTIVNPNGETVAVLQPGDRVGPRDDLSVVVKDNTGQLVDRTTEAGRTGAFVVPDSSGASPALTGSDAHFNNHPPATESQTVSAAQPTTQEITDAANQQLIDAFSKPVVISKENDVQLADASAVTGTGTVSDAGTGGIGLGNTSTPSSSEPNQPVALVKTGDAAPDSVAPGPDGSDAHFQHHPASSIAVPLAEGLTLVNTLIGLKNWDKQSDLSHLGTAVNLYNQVTQFAGVSGPLGNLGQFGAGIGFITTLQGNNPIAIASSGSSLANSLAGAEIIPIPFINALNIGSALQSGDPFAVASSVASCFPPWGTVASVVISILGGLRKPDIPPPPDGAVHYTWDETGAITIQTDHDVSGGAATANSTAGSVLTLLQSAVTDHNATNDAKGHSDNNLGIDPSRMPTIGFTAGTSWIEITHPDGSKTKETINPETIGERLLQIAVENDALAPVWQIQTAQAHAKAEHAAQVEAQAQAATPNEPALESATAIDGQSPVTATATSNTGPHNTAAVFGLEGKVQEAADHKTQSFAALVVHLHSPTAQEAITAIATPKINTVLQDVDGDGFWEQTQWVASKDDAGNAQGMLVLDRNNNGVIDATDILHLGGNSNERNSLAWLDANADGKLDASDPAFAAIKVFIDLNNDGRVDDGEMQSPQLSSINFQTGQINYTEGPSATLTATTLSGDTEGIKLDTIKVVGEDGKLEELKVGSVLVHEGYQGQVRVNSRGEIVADDDPATDTHLVSQRINSYEFNAAHLSDWEGTADQDQHRHGGGNVDGAPTETTATGATSMGAVLGKENVKTTTTMEEEDARTDGQVLQISAVGNASHGTVTKQTCKRNGLRGRFSRALRVKSAGIPRKTYAYSYNNSSNKNVHCHEFRKSLRRGQYILSHVHGVYAACFCG